MDLIFKIILGFHIAAGFIALFVAPMAMMTVKGGPAHRRWGKLFFWMMAFVALSALVMSVWKTNFFLLMIAVFSFYLAASGYRALYRRNVNSWQDVEPVDWILVSVSGIFSMSMILFGCILIFKNWTNAFGFISLVFGFIGTRSVLRDFRNFNSAGHYKKEWLYHHMGNMIGAYIATVSAFSAVNFQFLPPLIRWLWPTLIGVPLLIIWIRKYRNKKLSAVKVIETKN